MRRRTGSTWLPMIAVMALLASCAQGGGSGSAGSDNALKQGKPFELPRKDASGLSREARRGKVLYEYYCALCHGKTGDADGFNAYNLRTPPTEHTDPILMGTLSDTQIQRIVKEGGGALGRSPQMPPWGGVLSDREIGHITAFIRTLAAPSENARK